MSHYNAWQVVCIGQDCELYDKCENECLLNRKNQQKVKGCNYTKEGDCKYCSHKKKCGLIKPYSKELFKVEKKILWEEKQVDVLYNYVRELKNMEKNLNYFNSVSIIHVIKEYILKLKNNVQIKSKYPINYYDLPINKMLDRIHDKEYLIRVYKKKHDKLLNELK